MNKLNFTAVQPEKQELIDHWVEEIKSQLPSDIEESAKKYGAIQRKRGVKSALFLLRMLLIYATSAISIRLLALSGSVLQCASISDTAWHKKITATAPWLVYLLNHLLSQTVRDNSISKPAGNKNVYLIDGTCFRQAGKLQNIYRAHMSYCLNKGCMHEVKVTDNHSAESLSHYTIEANALYIADAGYGKAVNYEYVVGRKADVIFRITPNHFNAYDATGKKIDILQSLKSGKSIMELKCYSKSGSTLMPVRIIANKLPQDKIEAAIKRKKRKAQKSQSKVKPETLEYAKWVIIATSLDEKYTKEQVLSIYRSRWQIELLFKRIKQNLKIHTIRPASKKYAIALILLWLIVWALSEKQVYRAYLLLVEKGIDAERISLWNLHSLFFIRISTIIQNSWALLIDPCDFSRIAKYLLDHKSNRINQFFEHNLFILSLFVA